MDVTLMITSSSRGPDPEKRVPECARADPPDARQAPHLDRHITKTKPPSGPRGLGRRLALLIGGGGGNRTHVRKSLATGIYIHSRSFFALATRLSNRLDLRAASSLKSRPAPRSWAWSQSPEYDALTRTLMTRSGGRWRVLGRQG